MSIQIEPNEEVDVTGIGETQKKLGRLVRLNRRVLDLTQSGLGERAGVRQSSICKFEQHGCVTFEVFIRTARGLGLPAWALLKIAEDPEAYEAACSIRTGLSCSSGVS